MTRSSSKWKTPGVKQACVVLVSTMASLACQTRTATGDNPKPETIATKSPQQADANPAKETPASAASELARLDQRQPVPLLPIMAWHQKQNMMQHLQVIQQVVAAAAKEDWSGVAAAAKGIEATAGERQRCEHMGAGAQGFTELALDFHDRAAAISKAAQAHDKASVLEATANTLQACTSCHAAYRQEVVGEATWAQRTGSGHAPMHEVH